MAETFDPRDPPERAGTDGTPSPLADPFETGTSDMGFQVGLWDAAGIAVMTSGGIRR